MWLRYKKVLNDLNIERLKTLMLVLSIALGVFGVGTMLGSFTVLKREMAKNYMGTHPATATIEFEQPSIPESLAIRAAQHPDVKAAQRHATVQARMLVKDRWLPLLLFVVEDFRNKKTNRTFPVSGAVEPPDGTMLVERTSLPVLNARIGDRVQIKTPNGTAQDITISGTVHDPSLAPSIQEQTGYGYISLKTLHALGEPGGFNELRISLKQPPQTLAETTRKIGEITRAIETEEFKIHEIQIPPPFRHPHQGQMNAVLSLFVVFSFMVLILGAALTASSISTLMVRQVREIGIMKAIGASSAKISGMYILMTLMVSAAAVLMAVPLSRIAASLFIDRISALLNLTIFDPGIPHHVILIQVLSGFLIPLMTVLIPVFKGSRITVVEALNHYDADLSGKKRPADTRILSFLNGLSESLTLSFRNVFRKKSRLAVTLVLLSAGGMMFMTALNLSKAWDKDLQNITRYRHYDIEFRLNRHTMGYAALHPSYGAERAGWVDQRGTHHNEHGGRALNYWNNPQTDDITNQIRKLPGVTSAEMWAYGPTSLWTGQSYQIVNTYPDKGHGQFIMMGLPAKTPLLALPVTEGRWLKDDTAPEVVFNQAARPFVPGVRVGDTVILTTGHAPTQWKVAGFVKDIGSPATAFVPLPAFQNATMTTGKNIIRIALSDRKPGYAAQIAQDIETLLDRENVSVNQCIPVSLLKNAMAEHMGVLVNSLLAMAILMGAVGMLGLVSAMSMNVIERTREIGVMRTIGATPSKIRTLLIQEGLIIGIAGYVLAFILSIPLSYALGRFIGDMAFKTPLPLAVSMTGMMIWAVILVTGSFTATLYPAGQAVRISTREALNHI